MTLLAILFHIHRVFTKEPLEEHEILIRLSLLFILQLRHNQSSSDMFAVLDHITGSAPKFETKKALVIINCQNDAFYHQGDFYVTHNPEFLRPLRELIPYFRRVGDIIWVRTEMGVLPSTPSPNAEKVELESVKRAEQNKKTRSKEEADLLDDTLDEKARRAQLAHVDPSGSGPLPTYDPSSRIKQLMTRASADTRSERRSFNLQNLDDKDGSLEERLVKPRKGQQSRFFIAGTKGAEICDELINLMDENDMIVTKHFYSAFDQTSLLTSLRMSLITELYICGGVTNASIYSTAADAVQHGMGVTVLEDCLGWRSREKHDEALRQMSDIMGVNQISSEEIIEESGGRIIPDADTPGITLQELSLKAEAKAAQASLVADGNLAKIEPSDTAGSKIAVDGDSSTVARLSSDSYLGSTARNRSSMTKPKAQFLGPDDVIGTGDSRIVFNFLKANVANISFVQVQKEVEWQSMGHRGGQVPRLVAVQGEINKSGEIPIYRHPADESPPLLPFTPMVWKIKREVEKLLQQPFNHALIQLYRNGEDNISEHADKTLDIVRDSNIVNVSLGAQRVMTLRTKKPKPIPGVDNPIARNSQRIPMPHNSVFILGPETNRRWLHGVRADKRPEHEKTEGEKACNGERISLTFRQIGTFMNEDAQTIWGTGAKSKIKAQPRPISNDDSGQMEAMVVAFGKENHQADFDWDSEYGSGFDVVNLVASLRRAKFYPCSDPVANLRVRLSLEERSIPYEVVERNIDQHFSSGAREKPWIHGLVNTESPILSNLTPSGTAFEGDLAILIHLEKHHPSAAVESKRYTIAQLYSCIAQANELLYLWYELRQNIGNGLKSSPTHRFNLENNRPATPDVSLREELYTMLKGWEGHLADSRHPFIAGDFWSVIDCAFWPVFNGIVAEMGLGEETYPALLNYHRRATIRDSVRKLAREKANE